MKIIVLLVNCVLGIPYIKSRHIMGIMQRNIINFLAHLHWCTIVKAIDCYSNSVSEAVTTSLELAHKISGAMFSRPRAYVLVLQSMRSPYILQHVNKKIECERKKCSESICFYKSILRTSILISYKTNPRLGSRNAVMQNVDFEQ